MRSLFIVALVSSAGLLAFAPCAAGAEPAPSTPDAGAAVPARAPARGLAVLTVGDVSPAAWPLARAIYGKPALRPAEVDEAHARVLAGEPPPPGAAKELTDLAETRAAIHGDDAPSRQLLASIATTFHVRGIVVVMSSTDSSPAASPAWQARVFVAETASFDAARYAPEAADAGEADWSGAAFSLDRTYGAVALPTAGAPAISGSSNPAPALATQPLPKDNKEKDATSRPFYASPWFWGAVGAAALGATGLYFATRDNTPSTIHLQLQVPK
jgi:hypothetical protein